jgi:tripartite-type tricarboxylate transporter receptor subunit TctC
MKSSKAASSKSTTGTSRRQLLCGAAAGLAAANAGPLLAQAKPTLPGGYPNKPVKLVVAFPPGGLTDAYARLYAEHFTAHFGVPCVVENKPGAGGVIAIDSVVKSPADGYTLLITTSGTVWQNRVLYTKLPYNLDKDITPIAIFPSGPLVLGSPEKLGLKNAKELIEYAKANPSNMGSYAPGSYPHMVGDQLNRAEKTKITTIHYRGEAPMWIDVVSGQLQMAVGSYQAFNTVSGKGVRALGVTGPYRSPKLPDVPTLQEQGMYDALVSLEGGLPLIAPAGTPEPILRALNQVAVTGAEGAKAKALRESFGIPNKPKDLAGTRKDWNSAIPIWVKLAVDLGLKLD